jgi:hypothetical protein
MSRIILSVTLIVILLFTAPVLAQAPGDLNCNGFVDVSDLVGFLNFLNQPCSFQITTDCQRIGGDVDLDGLPITISDILILPSLLNPNYNPPYYSQNPENDTIMIGSSAGYPGGTVSLPLRISTADTIIAFQFLIEMDTNYVEFYTSIVYGLPLSLHVCDGFVYGTAIDAGSFEPILLPGDYYIADLLFDLKLENDRQVTAYLTFSSDMEQALYTGLANSAFFQPVTVDGEIEINP